MKTLPDGTPQFESSDGLALHNDINNKKLREWSEARRCVNCLFFANRECMYLQIDFTELMLAPDMAKPETFSCAAFESRSHNGTDKEK